MDRNLITKFINKNIAVGIKNDIRQTPFFYYGVLLQVDDNEILLELEGGRGFKIFSLQDILDLHLDRKYNTRDRRIRKI